VSGDAINQRIVLLFGSGLDAERSGALASEASQLASLVKDAIGSVDVSVISLGLSRPIAGTSEHIRLDESRRSFTDRFLTSVGAFSLRTRFATFPIGRLLNSLGPVDPSRVFWRAVRRHPEARRLLERADIAIATDLAATKTAWLAAQRGWVEEALYDHRSASVGISWQLPTAD